MTADVVSPQASVRVPHSLTRLEGSILSDKLHVLSQAGVVAVGNIAHLVRASTQEFACLDGGRIAGEGWGWGGGRRD